MLKVGDYVVLAESVLDHRKKVMDAKYDRAYARIESIFREPSNEFPYGIKFIQSRYNPYSDDGLLWFAADELLYVDDLEVFVHLLKRIDELEAQLGL